ncbi:cytochrome C biogenesis protein [Stenotrophomonas sp. 169]|nr:cytochrome C biogenesis protein [Stenotrophomonas sp. 169]
MVTLWLALLSGLAGIVLAACVLWPLRRRGRTGFMAACLSLGIVSASLYLLVGDPRAAQQPAAPSMADLRQGVEALEASLQREPQRADGWALLGRSRSELGQNTAAADAFARAAALAPDDAGLLVEAAQARAQAAAAKRFDDTALQWLQHALTVQPDAERAAWLLGIALRQRGRDAEAVEVWSALLPRLQPGAATALEQQLAIARAAAGTEAPATSPDPAQRNADPLLSVRIALPAGFDPAQWPQATALFVLARAPGGPPMPVAVRRYPLDGLPSSVTLSDADSPMPTQPLSAHARVEVLARLSRAGTASHTEGDLESEPVIVQLPQSGELQLQLR